MHRVQDAERSQDKDDNRDRRIAKHATLDDEEEQKDNARADDVQDEIADFINLIDKIRDDAASERSKNIRPTLQEKMRQRYDNDNEKHDQRALTRVRARDQGTVTENRTPRARVPRDEENSTITCDERDDEAREEHPPVINENIEERAERERGAATDPLQAKLLAKDRANIIAECGREERIEHVCEVDTKEDEKIGQERIGVVLEEVKETLLFVLAHLELLSFEYRLEVWYEEDTHEDDADNTAIRGEKQSSDDDTDSRVDSRKEKASPMTPLKEAFREEVLKDHEENHLKSIYKCFLMLRTNEQDNFRR